MIQDSSLERYRKTYPIECEACGFDGTVYSESDVPFNCPGCGGSIHRWWEKNRQTTIGQLPLTSHEIHRLDIGNQHSDSLSIIEYQVIKGAAATYGISDWTAKVDSSLTMDENVSRFSELATRNPNSSMREMKHKISHEYYEQGRSD